MIYFLGEQAHSCREVSRRRAAPSQWQSKPSSDCRRPQCDRLASQIEFLFHRRLDVDLSQDIKSFLHKGSSGVDVVERAIDCVTQGNAFVKKGPLLSHASDTVF